jgi:hypothetical protein
MQERSEAQSDAGSSGLFSGRTLLLGLAGGLAAWALFSANRDATQRRRFSDRGIERRNPMHFFLAGAYPRRRSIDLSGHRPLFERRQSVYDSY